MPTIVKVLNFDKGVPKKIAELAPEKRKGHNKLQPLFCSVLKKIGKFYLYFI